MCWNAPVSYASLIFGCIMIYLIWTRPASSVYKKSYDYWNVLFITSFVFVQLGEGLIHQGYNDIGRLIIFWCVTFQPIMQSIGGAYFGGISWLYYLAAISFIIIPFVTIDRRIVPSPNGHLVWGVSTYPHNYIATIYQIAYCAGLLLPLLSMTPFTRYMPLPIFGVVTLLISFYFWNKERSVSSMWCIMATIYSAIAYYVNMK